jgi:hypothetical protein
MTDLPPARAMTPDQIRDELAHEWVRSEIRRKSIRLRSPRLAELLDALAAAVPTAGES